MEKRAITSTSMLSISPTLRFFLSNINYFCTASCMEYKHKKIFISLCSLSHQVLTADLHTKDSLTTRISIAHQCPQHFYQYASLNTTIAAQQQVGHLLLCSSYSFGASHKGGDWPSHMVISSTVETRIQVSQVQHSFQLTML